MIRHIIFISAFLLPWMGAAFSQAAPPSYFYNIYPGISINVDTSYFRFYMWNDTAHMVSDKPFIKFNGHLLYPDQWISDSASFATKVYARQIAHDTASQLRTDIHDSLTSHTFTETDPVFAASDAAAITSSNISAWDGTTSTVSSGASGWDNASSWVSSYGSGQSGWDNASSWVTSYGGSYGDWNTAYGWGDHSAAGYQKAGYGDFYIHADQTYSVKNADKCITGFTEGRVNLWDMNTDSTFLAGSGAAGDYHITVSGRMARSNNNEPSLIAIFQNTTNIKHTDVFTVDAGSITQVYFIMQTIVTIADADVIKIKYNQASSGTPSIYLKEIEVIIERE